MYTHICGNQAHFSKNNYGSTAVDLSSNYYTYCLILKTTLQGRLYYYLHSVDQETKAQKDK